MNEKYISRDNLELVISGLKTAMTADWDENDKNGFGYIENKPFRTEYGVIVDNYSGKGNRPICNFVAGNTYDVIWNGRTYKGLVCHTDGEHNFIGGVGYPFYIDDDGGDGFYIEPESGFTVSILGDIFHQLDEKYIPNSIARVNDVVSAMDETVEIVNQTVTKKMDANNPVGTGSFSMNRKQNTVVGKYSHAEGYSATASGEASHAEGYATTADGHGSHAEGISTVAYASYSHAEGVGVNASSYASHAEGLYTTTSGNASHAEGSYTIASGDYSHTEGYHTTARADFQHVQGQYNILDMIGDGTENGKYAHIVGNGTSESSRSNAHTLDWKGVGWYQGGLQVGGNAQDDGAKNVLLEGDAIPVPETAETGQILSVKTVDTNGRPTEWCAVDAPNSGGSAGFVAQSTAPEDTSVLWIDIDDDSKDEFQKAVNAALAQAKASGEFDGEPGKDGVVPVVGATVGQTVKISAVDENGVPTAWESVDFPGGGEKPYELIIDSTIPEDCERVIFREDINGNEFEITDFVVWFDGYGGSNISNLSIFLRTHNGYRADNAAQYDYFGPAANISCRADFNFAVKATKLTAKEWHVFNSPNGDSQTLIPRMWVQLNKVESIKQIAFLVTNASSGEEYRIVTGTKIKVWGRRV